MPKPLPPHPNVRKCTHIKVTGQRCGSPALRGEFFCYFHTRVIKGVQQRVDMQLHSMAMLEDCESIQLSIMHGVDGLIKGTLDLTRARLIIQALRIAARNAKNVHFDDVHYRASEQPRVREVPDYARRYLIEQPEFGPPIEHRSAGAPAREAEPSPCSPGPPPRGRDNSRPARNPSRATSHRAKRHAEKHNDRPSRGAAKERSLRRKPWDGTQKQSSSEGAKNPRDPSSEKVENSKEYERIQQAEAAIPGAMAGNWRDLRAVFEFAGISEPNKEASVTREHGR
jgi:hypothetical protein